MSRLQTQIDWLQVNSSCEQRSQVKFEIETAEADEDSYGVFVMRLMVGGIEYRKTDESMGKVLGMQ